LTSLFIFSFFFRKCSVLAIRAVD